MRLSGLDSPNIVLSIQIPLSKTMYLTDVTVKQNGKVTITVRSVVSKDGKTITDNVDGVDVKGVKFYVVEVFEKQ